MTRPKIRYFIYDVAADTVALNIIFWEAFVHGLIANDEKKQNKTKKQKQKTNNNNNNKTKKTKQKNKKKTHSQFKARVQNPYPIYDQNGQNRYPIYDQNG